MKKQNKSVAPKKLVKVTSGYVIQTLDVKKNEFVEQQFIVGDDVQWEDGFGNPIDCPENDPYLPFEMIQPQQMGDVCYGIAEDVLIDDIGGKSYAKTNMCHHFGIFLDKDIANEKCKKMCKADKANYYVLTMDLN